MTTWLRILLISLILGLPGVSFGADFKTGDEQLNRWLINIDFVAQGKDRMKVVESIANQYSTNAEQLGILQENYEFSPGQLHVLLATFQVTEKDWSDLIAEFIRHDPTRYEKFLAAVGISSSSDNLKQFKSLIAKSAPEGDPEADYQKQRRRGH
ncbi:MAG: hypothetical protein HWE27_09960 [Gammaproteobacteria bacterium]|nr:hypothetical protein [Gammaproteobacteria bacterium]